MSTQGGVFFAAGYFSGLSLPVSFLITLHIQHNRGDQRGVSCWQ